MIASTEYCDAPHPHGCCEVHGAGVVSKIANGPAAKCGALLKRQLACKIPSASATSASDLLAEFSFAGAANENNYQPVMLVKN
jgi:hypothetical protein